MGQTVHKPPRKFTVKGQVKFLQTLAETGNVTIASAAINVSRKCAYEHKKAIDKEGELRHKAFSDAWDDAIEVACDLLEEEARRRAYKGVKKPVGFFRGKSSENVQEYSDSLLMFLLRAHRPKKYSQKFDVHGTGETEVTVIIKEPGYDEGKGDGENT